MRASQAAPPRVGALVLNYNGRDITLESLESLEAMTYPACDLFVVDNGSTDGSYEAIAERFPGVEQIRTEENLGPAGGLNLGVTELLGRDYDYLLILNNDIEADGGMLDELVAVAEGDPRIGCVGPKIFYFWNRDRLWSTGGIIRFRESVTRERGMGEPDTGQYERTEEVDYISGCAILIPTRVMREVGLYDPVFHLACEDADWGMRMKRLGYKSVYAYKAVLWHMVSMSTGVYKPGRTYQVGRSTAIFHRRYGSRLQKIAFFFWIALAIPAAFVRELPKGNQAAALAKLRGVIDGWRVPLGPPPAAEP